MDSERTGDGEDLKLESWEEFVRLANEFIDSGNLKELEVDYKRNLGREFADARKAVLDNAQDWVSRLRVGLRSRPGHPMTWRTIDDIKKWVDGSPEEAIQALQTLWTESDISVSERIRNFSRMLPGEPQIRGGTGTRIRLISALLMGLDATKYPPFAFRTFQNAYSRTGYGYPSQDADEAALYEHALAFLDLLVWQARAHDVPLHHRLDAQSVVWQLVDELPELTGTSTPPRDLFQEDWKIFVKLAKELIESGHLETEEVRPKLEVGHEFKIAREAVLNDAGEWCRLAKAGVKAAEKEKLVFNMSQTRFLDWIDSSQEEALQALKEIWNEDDLQVKSRIQSFCQLFPKEVVGGGAGTRMSVTAQLLMGLCAKKYPPFAKKRFENAYKSTGYKMPDRDADEAALYTHFLGFLDRFIEESQAHGVNLRHRLDAHVVVWLLEEEDALPRLGSRSPDPKTLREFADESLLSIEFLKEIKTLLEDKRQVIFQGPPGTGKTFVAQAFAECLAGSEDRVTLVQFHPSYAYEDFVRGYRPTLEGEQAGFALHDGPLLQATQKARNEPNAKHYLIIDEINRGNLAKVFGELYFLLEYRDKSIRMQYQQEGEESFSLPKNLYIIGTMNTADRSIALVDLALRRRFYFIEFHPDKDPVKSVLRKRLGEGSKLEWVADVVDEANELLKDDRHAAIGPSYFMKSNLKEEDIPRIWQHSVLPYIEERLFGDEKRIEEFEFSKLRAKAEQKRRQRQQTGQSGDDGNGDADSVNNETDQLAGVSGQQADPSND